MKLKLMSSSVVSILLIFSQQIIFAQSPLENDHKLEKIAEGFQLTEGPVWWESDKMGKEGAGLLFSDIPGNTINKWDKDSGTSIFLKPSGNSNGLAIDKNGKLIIAQHGFRRVIRLEEDGTQTVLASTYNSKKLNSPNDIAVKSDGAIYFTDPPYGINPEQEELGFYGIYRIDTNGNLTLLDSSLRRPNGIVFSPDESKLYVSDDEDRKIYVFDVKDDTVITNKKLFAFMEPDGDADGMKVDSKGNLYAAGPLGLWVFSPEGALLDTVNVPGQTTNCNWGDKDRKSLYITSGNAVFRIRIK